MGDGRPEKETEESLFDLQSLIVNTLLPRLKLPSAEYQERVKDSEFATQKSTLKTQDQEPLVANGASLREKENYRSKNCIFDKKIIQMNRKKILKQLKETVLKVSPEATIILYGSEARGDSNSDSDVDLLILVNNEILSYRELATITDPIYDIELKTGILISPLIYTKKQWENRPIKTPFYINVVNEGIRL